MAPVCRSAASAALQVLEQAAQWRDHGVRYLVLSNVSPLQRSLRKGLASAQHFTAILRELKRL
jgi:phthiodiolone/phenolphthiodiolone dimycocerosates ketoreductase